LDLELPGKALMAVPLPILITAHTPLAAAAAALVLLEILGLLHPLRLAGAAQTD
jgi:hypothetical protein